MKKKITIIIIFLLILALVIAYFYNYFTIDTRYAQEFAEAFYDYNIEKIDEYLNDDTKIIYRGEEDIYLNCRKNVVKACKEKEYSFERDSSYGYGNNTFENGRQQISIRLMGMFKGVNIGECYILMTLSYDNLFGYSIDSIECDSDVFGYIFFDSLTSPTVNCPEKEINIF